MVPMSYVKLWNYMYRPSVPRVRPVDADVVLCLSVRQLARLRRRPSSVRPSRRPSNYNLHDVA